MILTIHIDFERIPENMLGSCKNLFHTILCTPVSNAALLRSLKEEIRRLLMVLFNGDSADGTDLFALNEIMMKILCIAKKQRNTPFEQLLWTPLTTRTTCGQSSLSTAIIKRIFTLQTLQKRFLSAPAIPPDCSPAIPDFPLSNICPMCESGNLWRTFWKGKLRLKRFPENAGCQSSKAYSQIFKELYGITPSTYRKRFVKSASASGAGNTSDGIHTETKELLTKVFHLDDTNRLLFHAEEIQIVSDGDTLLCTLSDARQKELLLSQKEDDIVLTIRPSCTGT